MKKPFLILTVIGFSLLTSACTITTNSIQNSKKNTATTTIETQEKKYSHPELKYSFSYPSSWTIHSNNLSWVWIESKDVAREENENPKSGNIAFEVFKTDNSSLNDYLNDINPSTGSKNSEVYKFIKPITIDDTEGILTDGGCCGANGKIAIFFKNKTVYHIILIGYKSAGSYRNEEIFNSVLNSFKF